ncbi:MAG TPA: DUF2071 domain-containing protein [Candidatus Angelobacter sp.]|nr:DUF2071 domain-containing protein [Candidatus Angelobacter sp.]
MRQSSSIFLTAEWRSLAMLNYEVDPRLLRPLVPSGTELDNWHGKTFVSLVGFLFLNTKVFGVPIPFHRNFEEVNLRFYVRRREGNELRRGVVFVREIVPRWAIATVARKVYGEKYVSMPMSHQIRARADGGAAVEYAWRLGKNWNKLSLTAAGEPALPAEGSEEQFITEHYWGYAAQPTGGSVEYRVTHPSWRVWRAQRAQFEGEMEELYGRELAATIKQRPASAFLAEGSEIAVLRGHALTAARTATQ